MQKIYTHHNFERKLDDCSKFMLNWLEVHQLVCLNLRKISN